MQAGDLAVLATHIVINVGNRLQDEVDEVENFLGKQEVSPNEYEAYLKLQSPKVL